jgi:hypothetical protein
VPVAKSLAFSSLFLSGTKTSLSSISAFYTILKEYLFSILDVLRPSAPFSTTNAYTLLSSSIFLAHIIK